jgi:hypothetical protein
MKLFNKIRSWFKLSHNQLPVIKSKSDINVEKVTTTKTVIIENNDVINTTKQDNVTTPPTSKPVKSRNKKTNTKQKSITGKNNAI